MVRCYWTGLCVLALAYAAAGFPAASVANNEVQEPSALENGVDSVYRFLQSCGDRDISLCIKMRALTFVDRALRKQDDISIVSGVKLVKTDDTNEASRGLNGRAMSEDELDASLPKNAEDRETAVETMLVDRIARFLQSRTLQLKVPESSISDIRKTLDEGNCHLE